MQPPCQRRPCAFTDGRTRLPNCPRRSCGHCSGRSMRCWRAQRGRARRWPCCVRRSRGSKWRRTILQTSAPLPWLRALLPLLRRRPVWTPARAHRRRQKRAWSPHPRLLPCLTLVPPAQPQRPQEKTGTVRLRLPMPFSPPSSTCVCVCVCVCAQYGMAHTDAASRMYARSPLDPRNAADADFKPRKAVPVAAAPARPAAPMTYVPARGAP
jgi:hypothetical protein